MVHIYKNKDTGKIELHSNYLGIKQIVDLTLEYVGAVDVNTTNVSIPAEDIINDSRLKSGEYDLLVVTPEEYLILEKIKNNLDLKQMILNYIKSESEKESSK